MKSIRFIINPIAGRHPDASGTVAFLKRKCIGVEASFAVSERAGHMRELALEAVREGVDAVVSVGGDGSVNEVAGAVAGSDTALGIIPKGSGNGLARHLGISLRPDLALNTILGGRTVSMDCGMMNGNPFFCTMGVGFDAKVGMDYALSGHRGLITYADKALRDWNSYQPLTYNLTIDGRAVRLKAALITVANANQWGNGFHIAPNASVVDGLFDITAVKSLKTAHTLEMPLEILGYAIDHNAEAETFRGRDIRLECDAPGYYHLDGEPFEWPSGALKVTMRAASLKIIVPLHKKQF